MAIKFDEVIDFDQEKYEDNIARHTFPERDGLDGKGEVQDGK